MLKPKGPLPFKEHQEVEIDVRAASPSAGEDASPESFVGFIKGGIKGLPVAAHHDKFLDQDQYAHLKVYLRRLMTSPDWNETTPQQRLERFVQTCKNDRPDLQDLWEDMDRLANVWSNAFEYCSRALEREEAPRRG